MELIRDTEKLLIYNEVNGNSVITYRQHKEDPNEQFVKIYETHNNSIEYRFEGEIIQKIYLFGFSEIPMFLSPFGYGFKEKALHNFFRFKLKSNSIDTITILDNIYSEYESHNNELILYVEDIELLQKEINQEQRACNETKTILISNHLLDLYPDLELIYKDTNNNKELVLRNLNKKLINQLTAEDIEFLGEFYVEATKKYTRPDIVRKLVLGLQKNSQLIALNEIINNYEKLLNDNPKESIWQDFFNNYITLFDNRYLHKLDYKNIAVGITKYPDLVLVDIYGYIDFYELKKSDMRLLQYDDNHNTFFWSKELSMTIAQASDYLQKARENSIAYSKTIKEVTSNELSNGIEVNIINPRAIIVAGRTSELNSIMKRNQFKNLRESLKDIEFVLYDELLDRLKNLLNSIK